MPNEYGFILDTLRFSYSSASSFDGCPYGFYLTYILNKPRENNAFSEYGTLMHEILEDYFVGKIDLWDLPKVYKERYEKAVTLPFPPYPVNMGQQYYDDGLSFFENFDFPLDKYEVLLMEDDIRYKYHDIDLIVKPDLVLRNKITNKIFLVDFKSSKLKGNAYDKKKLDGYLKQMYLYTYFIWLAKDIKIDGIKIWFIRNNEFKDIPIDDYEMTNIIDWFEKTVYNIKEEKEWKPNKTKENDYFCKFLCSVKNYCQY